MNALPPLDHQHAIEAVSHCGVPMGKIRLRYDRVTQDDVVLIERLHQSPSREAMRCIFEATTSSGYVVQFRDLRQSAAFWSLALEEGRARARLEGQQWLRERGLFDHMPTYDPARADVGAFARTVEVFCGLEPGSALEARGRSLLSPRTDFLERMAADPGGGLGDKFTCLRNVLAASDLAEGGVQFGIVSHYTPPTGGHH